MERPLSRHPWVRDVASEVRDDGLGRALRRRITLLFAGCSGCPAPIQHDCAPSGEAAVLRRESGLTVLSQSSRAGSPDRACVHPSSLTPEKGGSNQGAANTASTAARRTTIVRLRDSGVMVPS